MKRIAIIPAWDSIIFPKTCVSAVEKCGLFDRVVVTDDDYMPLFVTDVVSTLLRSPCDDVTLALEIAGDEDCVIAVIRDGSFDFRKAFSIMEESSADSLFVAKRPDTPVLYGNGSEASGVFVPDGRLKITSLRLLKESGSFWAGRLAMYHPEKKNAFTDYSRIRAVFTDCDGCLTDGGMYYSEKGDELKKFNTRDGMGFSLLRKKGILTGIITGENVELNRRRVEKLNLDVYVPGCADKLSAAKEICKSHSLSLDEVAYIGDDIIDLPLLKAAGFSACPADAVNKVKEAVDYVSILTGGRGVLREVAELILSGHQ